MRRLCFTAVVILLTVTTASLALVAGEQLDIPWHRIDGGGTTASCGGSHCLSGSIGQPLTAAASGGIYAMQGGFWAVASAPVTGRPAVYLPLILR